MDMATDEQLKEQLSHMLEKTDLGLGKRQQGKVRDSYIIDDKRVIVTTDRVSAFDRVLCTIPFKGQVLNQTAEFWFRNTEHIVKNHIIEVPDPNVTVAKECELIPVEMVVRGFMTGSTTTSVWHHYKNGVRDFCGNALPEGMVKNQRFDQPIITPSTKAEQGEHDESVSGEELIRRGVVTRELYEEMAEAALKLYQFGNEHVGKNNLILVDTKYEFGLLDGKLVLIDEVHTPDSSRFWIKDTYQELFDAGKEPDKLDKEYVRLWLADKGFTGDGDIPQIPDEVKMEAARRYIKAYEMITGKTFEAVVGDVNDRIKSNLKGYLG